MQIQHVRGQLIKATLTGMLAVSGVSAAHAQAGGQARVALATAKAATPGADQKICATELKASSRIPRKTCKTAAEWELERQSRDQKAFDMHQRN